MTRRGRIRPHIATLAVSALIALSGAAQWPALYAQARNAPAKSGVSTTMGCEQRAPRAQGAGLALLNPQGRPAANVPVPVPDSMRGTKKTSGTCAGNPGK